MQIILIQYIDLISIKYMFSISSPAKGNNRHAESIQTKNKDKKSEKNQLIHQIINLKDENGNFLIQKYSTQSIMANIEKHQIQIVQLFSKYLKEGFNLLEFVRFFLNIIPHDQIENLYLAVGLIDLFREITMETHKDKIRLKDITDYMCDKILKNNQTFNKIKAKYIPYAKFICPSKDRKISLETAPIIYGETDQKIHKLSQKSIKTDSSKHSRAIIKSQFCFDLKKIFILDSLSESISVYDENCILQKKISPVLSKLKKEVIILSFAFSKRQYRIGAVLKDFSLKFWDHYNNFEYQKSISTTSVCQSMQTGIYFLEYFNNWITTDKTGVLHFWNLLEEKPERDMKCKYSSTINDICEISSLNLIAVVQECKRASKLLTDHSDKGDNALSEATVVVYNFYNGHIITEIDLVGQRIPHTILYSETYQALFMSGLQKKIKIYELHPKYMDASLRGELIGHQNLITNFTLISDTPMLVSADDKGKVKLWDFRTFMCLQTIDFSDKTIITNVLDMIQIGKIGVFGSRVNYIQFQQKLQIIKKRTETENLKVEWIDFDQNQMEMYLFANKTLRVLNLNNGQIKHIFSFKYTDGGDEFTVFRYFSCLKKFVFGNTKGEIAIYNPQTGQVQSKLKQCHQGAITFIQFDQLNKLYLTVGYDSKILIHRSCDGSMVRELKNNFNGKQISCIEMSVYHNLLLIGSNSSSSVYCWNYQYGKLVAEIKLKEETPASIYVVNGYGLVLVATNEGRIHLFKIGYFNMDVQIQYLSTLQTKQVLLNVLVDLKLRGKAKNTYCQTCKLLAFCQNGLLIEYDIIDFMQRESFKPHCKEKTNYNPYREGKESFVSQLQKLKHLVYDMGSIKEDINGKQLFANHKILSLEFSSLNICKLMKLQQSLKVMIGNDRRMKIWNESNVLLCDANINYSLPYKWDFLSTALTFTTQKIYYGIKVIQNIVKKYDSDISIGEAKNLEIRELFNCIDKQSTIDRTKMMTEPEQGQSFKEQKQSSKIMLLQNEYSKRDLNFELVKRFNFTQIGGPALKQIDNIKKLSMLQMQWKIKEEKEEKEKDLLLKNIESKAKKNEEKDHLQYVLIKQKKDTSKQFKSDNQQISNLAKKLNTIEVKEKRSNEDKKIHTAFNKSFFRLNTKMDFDKNLKNSKSEKTLDRLASENYKKSFEGYYADKFGEGQEKIVEGKDRSWKFRDILTEMNGRISNIKKYRYRKNKPLNYL